MVADVAHKAGTSDFAIEASHFATALKVAQNLQGQGRCRFRDSRQGQLPFSQSWLQVCCSLVARLTQPVDLAAGQSAA